MDSHHLDNRNHGNGFRAGWMILDVTGKIEKTSQACLNSWFLTNLESKISFIIVVWQLGGEAEHDASQFQRR
jgi:hypothetical protein